MKHSGLQKSISSIFDGVEPPKQETATAASPQTPAQTASPGSQSAQPAITPPALVGTAPVSMTALQRTMSTSSAGAAGSTHAAKPAARPSPVPRQTTASKQKISFAATWTMIKARLFGGSKKTMDPRQKKAMILVGVLSVALVAVVLFVLGSNPSSAKAASKNAGSSDSSVAGSQSCSTENWKKPEIYPLSLRDPMKPSSNASAGDGQNGEMTVRGIVFSNSKPSAIIANQIVSEGDVILGVTIIKIGKDFVAFEKKGKRWQQQVRQ
jgi:hypothetical protein